jgi:hypothetical protein
VPYYARLTATLNLCLPDFGTKLVDLLLDEFRYLNKKKNQINIEGKVCGMGTLCCHSFHSPDA